MTEDRFAKGMKALGVAFGRETGDDVSKLYFGLLKRLTDEQWNRAVTHALTHERFFPPPAVIIEAAGANGAQEPMLAEAGRALDAVIECRTYSPECGAIWSLRDIRERLGDAAADAFVAVGGGSRLQWITEEGRPFLVRDFTAAYLEARKMGRRALPPAPSPRPALPPADDDAPAISEAAARSIVARIAAEAGVGR
jgi:hypothetical protein